MIPDDLVLVYDSHGYHLLPILDLGYGCDLDAAVSLADAQETLCPHDQQTAKILRAGSWTDQAITTGLGVPACALPSRPDVDLLVQLRAASERVSA